MYISQRKQDAHTEQTVTETVAPMEGQTETLFGKRKQPEELGKTEPSSPQSEGDSQDQTTQTIGRSRNFHRAWPEDSRGLLGAAASL